MKRLFPLVLFYWCHISFSQYGINCEVEQWKLNIITPSLEFEKGVGSTSTINLKVGYQAVPDVFISKALQNWELFPAITLANRHYFNLFRPSIRARPVFGNAGEYIAPVVSILREDGRILNDPQQRGFFGYGGLMLGMQRNYFSGLTFSIEAGPAYFLGDKVENIKPLVNLSLGWMISERRWCRR